MSKRVTLPEGSDELANHLAGLGDAQLAELEGTLVAEFDGMYGEDGQNVGAEDMAVLSVLADQITAIRGEGEKRTVESAERATKVAQLREAVHVAGPEDDEETTDPATEEDEPVTDPSVEAIAAAVAQAVAMALTTQRKIPVENLIRKTPSNRELNRHLSLSQVRRHAPDPGVPDARPSAVYSASADIPGFTQGGSIPSMERLAEAMHHRARNLPISQGNGNWVPVASLNRAFKYQLALDSTPEHINEVLLAAMDVENLIASGGWCAPSEIRYDFFNIVAEDGLIDLPTAGVLNRGGIRYPTSPTFNDIVSASPNGLWTWTEASDIAAATGSPTKPCVRVPCPGFNEDRLACDGLCVTAGNLIDYAYPEQVANFLKLMMAARAHLTNTRIIGLLTAASTAVNMTTTTAGNPESDSIVANLLNAIELQATDYRSKFATADDAIMEVVLPSWVDGPMRSSWQRRAFTTDPVMTDQMMMDWFNARDVRVQFVQDWQVRAAGLPGNPAANNTAWPATLQFMLYAPGTFLRGQGMSLDLGVVRDSVLNQTNDHTAAWMEDCYSVSKVGHESRLVTTNICVAGTTGATNVAC